MQFSRLRLSGFKSFVDPVDLDILPGLTGVVGPNGCGKSNLLEALRWVMGETSYKSMRGAGMEDVIFSGTTSRPSRNNAEVALYLENNDHSAPSEYNDEELLEIIRRIERDAGSAYRINGRDVRAKDVQLLFADASTGARSTALVKQGQIGELINSKPESRRRILEEAAGISGLHSRRHEAELRLRAAETNLEKLDETMGQMESQLRALRRQARQATRYRALSGQIRQTEALVFHVQWHMIVTQLAEIETALQTIKTDVQDKTQAAARASTVQSELQASLTPLREAEAASAAALRRLTIERENLDAEERRAREMIERLQRQCADLQADQAREQLQVNDASTQTAAIAEEIKLLESENSQDAAQVEAAAQNNLAEKAAALETLEAELDTQTRAVADRAARQQALTQEIEIARLRLERLQAQAQERQAQQQNLKQSCPPEDMHSELFARKQAAEENLARLTQMLHEVHGAVQDAENKVEAGEAPLKAARALAERLIGERAALSALFARPDGANYPSIVDALAVEAGYEMALGAALGDDLIASSDETAPAHWRSLPPLEVRAALPAGVTPLSDFVSGVKSLERRLTQVGVVRDKAQAKELQKQLALGQRLVSIDGDLWRWDGYCAAAEAPTAAAQRLAQRNRLKEIGEELKRAEADLQRQEAELADLKQEHRDYLDREAAGRIAVDEARDLLGKIRDELSEDTRQREDFQARSAAIAEALEAIQNDMAEQTAAHDRAEAEMAGLPNEQAMQEKSQQLRQHVAEARVAASEARTAFDQLRSQRQLREARLEKLQADFTSWQGRHQAAVAQVDALGERLNMVRADLDRVAGEPEQIEARKASLIELIQTAELDRKTKADTLAEAETSLAAADREARAIQTALSEVREALARQEANRENAKQREEEIGRKIREVLQVEPDKVLALADHEDDKPLPEISDIEARLEKFRREREGLGGVNLQADSEADEIEAQLSEMRTERDDLGQAINKLRYGIGQLNREGRERLLAAFESVNTHFQRLFTQLFGGGTARLELTESDDPLEAGLEIIAHPPGKKPQMMSLLSGGEQALTAMAMIFAVFLTNPSPICVLDEVDAPLDDANVERFCQMIREIADETKTRFLLITHHALTMARVDRLFGVTMQEQGVSSLISVDLAQAERYAESGGAIEDDFDQRDIG
jgi:chromosome segregation protein